MLVFEPVLFRNAFHVGSFVSDYRPLCIKCSKGTRFEVTPCNLMLSRRRWLRTSKWTLDKNKAEEETRELTNQVLDEIGVDVSSSLFSAPKGQIASKNAPLQVLNLSMLRISRKDWSPFLCIGSVKLVAGGHLE
ncbi:hypothetical protein D5086_012858 [Populus alba]|uniref:Uncharacterized protein n=1 Tax=Populus alba TaxID=43335 RepID=A0ACC4C3L6_POPAL